MSDKKIILVADDDPHILAMLAVRLGKSGYQVVEASDGQKAIELAHRHHPHIVILDVMMPQKNGWEVAKALRADAAFAHTGIIMLTAIGEKVNEMTSPLYGADEHMDKPFDFDVLEKKIAAVLKARN